MEYLLPPYAQVEPWAFWKDGFTTEELDKLEADAASANEGAGVSQKNTPDEHIRRSKVKWLYGTPENRWLFDKLTDVVLRVNTQFFRFDLLGFGEPLQLTRYESENNGKYDWHQDFGGIVSRKLSVTVQLTDPDKYEGGRLELQYGADVDRVPKERGYIAIFPSYQLHRVTPVVEGVRHSLVAWVSGPAFR